MKKKIQQRSIGPTTYTVFGQLAAVEEDDDYLILVSDEGQKRRKSKRYYPTWQNSKAKAETLIGAKVVTVFGGSGLKSQYSPYDYFNDLLHDSGYGLLSDGLLEVPDDAGPNSTREIIRERISAQHSRYYAFQRETGMSKTVEQMKAEAEGLLEEVKRLEEERSQLTPEQLSEVEKAIIGLDKEFDNWLKRGEMSFYINGFSRYNTLGHVDKSFMLRYGIDVTRKKRISFRPMQRERDNYIGGNIIHTSGEETPCIIGVKISNSPDARNQWAVVTTEPMDIRQYRIEKRVLGPGGKDALKPISWFKEQHEEIMKRMRQNSEQPV